MKPPLPFNQSEHLQTLVGLPLKEQGRPFGVLMHYQSDTTQLPEDEAIRLRDLADNLAFGIINLRSSKELRQTHDAVLAMSRGASNIADDKFCEKLIFSAVETLGAHAGFIASFNHDQASATTICAVFDGNLVENFEFPLDGIPCEYSELNGVCMVPKDAGSLCPTAGIIVDTGSEAYASARLYRTDGQLIGLMILLFRQPISQCAFTSSMLLLFVARVSNELERLRYELDLLRIQRIESSAALTRRVAHDINNVLTPIVMSIEMLRIYLEDPDGLEILDLVAASADRGAGMVKQILSMNRGVEVDVRKSDLAPIIDGLLRIILDTFPKNVWIESDLQPAVWQVRADPDQIHKVLLSLCVNARDAMPDGGKISLSVRNIMMDKQEAEMNPDAHPGQYVLVQVADTGHGIPRDIIEKIFEPFFTTKQPGRGSGLGLSSTLTIIKHHGGFIRVSSDPGEGTRFLLYLPAICDRV